MKPIDLESLMALCGRIRVVFPNALIGGGAVRDTFLGASVKDIDVFVQCSPSKFGEMCDDLAAHLEGTIESSQEYVHAPSYNIRVPGFTQELNVVWRDCSPLMDVGDYDFGICQIALSDTEMFKTAAFMKDVANNTVTYMHAGKVREGWHRKSSANRMLRIVAKHPSLKPVDCDYLFEILNEAAPPAGL